MNISRKKNSFGVCFWSMLLTVGILMSVLPETAPAKSLYVIADHHTAQFDSYNINPDGTITLQMTHNLLYATDPSGMAIWVDPTTTPPEGAIFVTSEFSLNGVECWDAKTMTFSGTAPGGSDLAGIAVDSVNNVIYAVERYTSKLYVYDWNPVAQTLTPKPGFNPYTLPNCSGAFGIAFDEKTGTLWVADSPAGVARAYDVSTWAEDTTKSFTPSHLPIDIEVDSQRGIVYTVSMNMGAWTPSGAGSTLLSKYDLATQLETTGNLSCQGVGVAVDESSGYVYLTVSPYCTGQGTIQVWDTSTTPWYQVQVVNVSGSPAGIAIGNVGVNLLNLAKNDTVVGYGVYIGQTFTYEITFDNSDNAFDVTNVTAIDSLPVALDFMSETLNGVPGGVYDPIAHTVTWDIGTLPAGYTGGLIELVVKVNQNAVGGGTIYNYCTIDSDQTPPTTEEGKDPDNPEPGEPGTYIIPNQPPDCSDAYADPGCLWSPTHKLVKVHILGVTDPDGDPVTITITSITSDEPTASDEGAGGAKHAPDAAGVGECIAQVRAERSGDGNGRVYEISFIAYDDMGGECEGSVIVCVPHDQSGKNCECTDDGQFYDATQIN